MGQENQDNKRQQNGVSNLTRTVSTSSDRLPQPQNAKPQMLPAAIAGSKFLPALERLCSAKNTVQLTPHAAETWIAALAMYAEKPQIVHQAIIEIAISEDQFPDLGKVLAKCELIRRTSEGTLPQDASKVAFKNVTGLAKAWGLEI